MDHRKPKFHSQVRYTQVKDEGLIIAQEAGEIHIVSEVASFLLPLLDGSRTIEDLVGAVEQEYDVDAGTARSDIEEFLSVLEKNNLIEYES